MPFVSVVVSVLLSSTLTFAADDGLCEGCNIFQRQVDISGSQNATRHAVRPPVFQGGATRIPQASERQFNRGPEPFANPVVQVVPANPAGTVSLKRLSHKLLKAA